MNGEATFSADELPGIKAALRLQDRFIERICERAEKAGIHPSEKRSRLIMDLQSVPELDLPALLGASDYEFSHDITGIVNHMDRSTYPGKLTGCFWPRNAAQR